MMFPKKKKLRMILPAGVGSMILELPFKTHEAIVGFIDAERPHPSPACNPEPEDMVSCKIVHFNHVEIRGLMIEWKTSGPREIEWMASTGKV